MQPTVPSADVLTHVRAIMGIILGLGLAQLLIGLARFAQHPGQHKIYWIHVGWLVSTFLLLVNFWWWEARISLVSEWTFARYLFIILFSSLFYFLCVMLLPDNLGEFASFRDYFYSRKKWFFGTLALIFAADLFDTWLKGEDYFNSLGLEYPVRAAAGCGLCLVGMFVRNECFHAAFVIVNLVYQVSWIFRSYNHIH